MTARQPGCQVFRRIIISYPRSSASKCFATSDKGERESEVGGRLKNVGAIKKKILSRECEAAKSGTQT